MSEQMHEGVGRNTRKSRLILAYHSMAWALFLMMNLRFWAFCETTSKSDGWRPRLQHRDQETSAQCTNNPRLLLLSTFRQVQNTAYASEWLHQHLVRMDTQACECAAVAHPTTAFPSSTPIPSHTLALDRTDRPSSPSSSAKNLTPHNSSVV